MLGIFTDTAAGGDFSTSLRRLLATYILCSRRLSPLRFVLDKNEEEFEFRRKSKEIPGKGKSRFRQVRHDSSPALPPLTEAPEEKKKKKHEEDGIKETKKLKKLEYCSASQAMVLGV
ncbi:hypothetical protein LINPERHAP2_LOCUS38000 [Linum perenne]